MLKKIMIIAVLILAGLLALVFVGALLIRSWMSAPLYTPGIVQAEDRLRASLEPPTPNTSDAAAPWLVEPGIALAHFEVGQGAGPPILVVHGGPGFPFTKPLAALDSLTNDHRFIYYDQRGSGGSTRPIDTFTAKNFYTNLKELDGALGLGAQIADLERIRRLLGVEKIILLGHSFGGFIATLYAVEFPQHVEALVLVAPADVLRIPQADGGIFSAIRAKLPYDLQNGYDAFVQEYLNFSKVFTKSEAELQQLNWRFGEYFFIATGQLTTLPPIDAMVVPANAPGWMVQALYLSMGKKHDYRGALTVVEVPTLVLHGQTDLIPVSASQQYVDLLPQATLKVIESAGHNVFNDQPEQFRAAVAEFLSTLGQ